MPSNDSPRFRLSLVQLVASALAAVTAAVAGSYLGVNGTVIGAAVASVLSVAATALYSHSLQRTGERVRAVVPASSRWIPPRPAAPVQPAPRAGGPRRAPRTAVAAMAALAVFAAALAFLTGVEVVAGRPVSDLLAGKAASGTTVFGSTPQLATRSTPDPSVTVTVVPKVVVTTPTVTSTAPAVTVTPTITPPNTPTSVPTGSAAPSGTSTR
jgi:hypothetical protein